MNRILLLMVALYGAVVLGCDKKQPTNASLSQPVIHHNQYSLLPVSDPSYQTTFSESYDSGEPDSDELEGVQCPIPMECRVRNYTGIQCVFSSLECLARWAEYKELLEPTPLTSRPDCKGYSSPWDASSKLSRWNINYDQEVAINGNRDKSIALIKKAMAEGRGCLWGVPGHAMVLCHYDEKQNVVKWIDNSDRSLRIQTTTVANFHRRWDGWVIVLYAEPDLFPAKAMGITLPNMIPIIDRNNPQGEYPKDYIPTPS